MQGGPKTELELPTLQPLVNSLFKANQEDTGRGGQRRTFTIHKHFSQRNITGSVFITRVKGFTKNIEA